MRHFLPIYIGILIFTFLIHISYIPNGFIWLDHRDIEAGRSILPLSKLYLAFFQRFADTGFYRPLVTILNSVDFAFFANWAPGYHLTNVILHTLTTAAMAGFISAFFNLLGWQLLLATFIFGIHPLSILPVGAISYRPELLLGLFTFLTIFFYARFRKNPTRRLVLATITVLLLALFAKETAIVIIPLLILFWEFSQNKLHRRILKKTYLSITAIVPFLIYSLLRYLAVPELWRISGIKLSLSEAIGTRIIGLEKLLLYLISPFKPPLSDAVQIVSLADPRIFLTGLSLIAILAVTGYVGVRSNFGRIIVLLSILILPGLNIIPLPRFTSPHYAYLSVGVMAAAVVILLEVLKGTPKTIFSIAIFLWLLTGIFSTFRSGFLFKNDLTLFQREVKSDPNFLEGHFYLGKYYLDKGEIIKAGKEYETGVYPKKGIIAFRDKFLFLINLGGVRLLENRFDEAEKLYKDGSFLASECDAWFIDYNLALIAYKQKDYKKVVSFLENQPYDSSEPYILLAKSYYLLGKNRQAELTIKKALPYLSPHQLKNTDTLYNE